MLLARKLRLAATIEEVGDVGVFLGFGDAQLFEASIGNNTPENSGQLERPEQCLVVVVQLARIFDHAEPMGRPGRGFARKFGKIGIGERG